MNTIFNRNYYKNETIANLIALILSIGGSILAALFGFIPWNLELINFLLNNVFRIVSSCSYAAKILDDYLVYKLRYSRNIFHFRPHNPNIFTDNGIAENCFPLISRESVGAFIGFCLGIIAGIGFSVFGVATEIMGVNGFGFAAFVFSMGGLVSAVFARICRMFDPENKYDDQADWRKILKQQIGFKTSIILALIISALILLSVALLLSLNVGSLLLLFIVIPAGLISGFHYVGRLVDTVAKVGFESFFQELIYVFHRNKGNPAIEREKLFLAIGLVVGCVVAVAILATIGPPAVFTALFGLSWWIANGVGFFSILGGVTGVITRIFGRTQDHRFELQQKEQIMKENLPPEKSSPLNTSVHHSTPASNPSTGTPERASEPVNSNALVDRLNQIVESAEPEKKTTLQWFKCAKNSFFQRKSNFDFVEEAERHYINGK